MMRPLDLYKGIWRFQTSFTEQIQDCFVMFLSNKLKTPRPKERPTIRSLESSLS